jgi:hypothetical protein
MNYSKQNTHISKIFTFRVKSMSLTFLLVAFLGLLTFSCKSDSDEALDTQEQSIELQKTLETQAEVEKTEEGVNDIVEDAYYFEEIDTGSRTPQDFRFLPDCVTITRVITQTTKTVTLDFGSGCELRNGDIVSGIIMFEYAIDFDEQSKTIQVSFNNFYFNDKNVAGNSTLVRTRQNDNGNPQSTYSVNITVTWPDGTYASKQGQKTREWIEGVGTPFWGDNVFLITGNWTFVKHNGNVYSATITTPLRKELSCRFIVSGVIELNRNGHPATLDFGDGTCDAFGVITIDGVDHDIRLRH